MDRPTGDGTVITIVWSGVPVLCHGARHSSYWENDGISDHVGIVEKVENGLVHTVERNINDRVVQKQYTLGSWVINGYGYM